MGERKPANAPALLARIYRVGNTHPRRIDIAAAFYSDPRRANELAAELLGQLQDTWGLVEWWTDAQLAEWLERTSELMQEPIN